MYVFNKRSRSHIVSNIIVSVEVPVLNHVEMFIIKQSDASSRLTWLSKWKLVNNENRVRNYDNNEYFLLNNENITGLMCSVI